MRTSLPENCQTASLAGLTRRNPPSERCQTPQKAYAPPPRRSRTR
jgi:hypothetical protein